MITSHRFTNIILFNPFFFTFFLLMRLVSIWTCFFVSTLYFEIKMKLMDWFIFQFVCFWIICLILLEIWDIFKLLLYILCFVFYRKVFKFLISLLSCNSDDELQLDSEVSFVGKKKSLDKRITGFQVNLVIDIKRKYILVWLTFCLTPDLSLHSFVLPAVN